MQKGLSIDGSNTKQTKKISNSETGKTGVRYFLLLLCMGSLVGTERSIIRESYLKMIPSVSNSGVYRLNRQLINH